MESPDNWSLRQWLAFMLLLAADADGERANAEMRILRVELGGDTVAQMLHWMQARTLGECEAILKDGLPKLLQERGAREKIQRLLRDVFMADGEYGPAEQAMTRKIGDWIRESSH